MMSRERMEAAVGAAEVLATPFARESVDHGPKHWQDVAYLGLLAIRLGVPADPDFVVLFGALHDTQRLTETSDPEHGPRAAGYVESLWAEGLVDAGFLAPLAVALATHSIAGVVGEDPSMAACFDADRVTLPRVGIAVDRSRLSTGRWLNLRSRGGGLDRLYRLVDEGEARANAEEPLGWARVLDLWAKVSAVSAGTR